MSTGSDKYQYLNKLRVAIINAGVTPNTTIDLVNIIGFTITQTDSEPSYYELTLDNNDMKYTRGNSNSSYSSWIEPLKQFEYNIEIEVCGPSGMDSRTIQHLTPIEYNTSIGPTGRVVTLKLTDQSWLLMKENQTMKTWRSSKITLYTASAIILDIMNYYGVAFDSGGFNDYNVKFQHVQGQIPLDIVKLFLEIRYCSWFISDAGVFTLSEIDYKLDPNDPDYVINDKDTVYGLSYGFNRFAPYTRVVVRRTEEGGDICFEEEGSDTVEHSLDFNSNFPDGATGVRINSKCSFGYINEIYLFEGKGKTGASAKYGGGKIPITVGAFKSVGFFFQPMPHVLEGSNLYYHIVGRGVRPVTDEYPGEDYIIKRKNTTLENYLGESRPAQEPVINSLIVRKDVALSYADNFLYMSAAKLEEVHGEIGLEINMKPRQTIQIREPGCGFDGTGDDSRFWLGSTVHDVMGGTTSIVAYKYRNDTIDDYVDDVPPNPPIPPGTYF